MYSYIEVTLLANWFDLSDRMIDNLEQKCSRM